MFLFVCSSRSAYSLFLFSFLHTHTCTHTHTHTHARTRTHVRTCTCMHIHTHLFCIYYFHLSISFVLPLFYRLSVCMCVCLCVCLCFEYVCMQVYVSLCMRVWDLTFYHFVSARRPHALSFSCSLLSLPLPISIFLARPLSLSKYIYPSLYLSLPFTYFPDNCPSTCLFTYLFCGYSPYISSLPLSPYLSLHISLPTSLALYCHLSTDDISPWSENGGGWELSVCGKTLSVEFVLVKGTGGCASFGCDLSDIHS